MAARTRRGLEFEPLEPRMVLSRPPGLTLAALGDSYTAEYSTNPTGVFGARNWVEILSATHRATFSPAHSQPSLGLPNLYFPYNRAVPGATTADVLQTQLPALLPAVASGSVKYVCLFVGINDFGRVVTDFVEDPGTPEQDLADQVDQALASAESNLDRTVMRLFQADPDVKVVVATIPDVPSLPLMAQALARPGGQALGVALYGAVQAYNEHIRLLASWYPSAVVADVGATFQAKLGLTAPGQVSLAATSGPDLDDVFLIDGLHPNTIPQGWIADDFLNALRSKFRVRAAPVPGWQVNRLAQVAQRRQTHGTPMP